MALIIHNRAFKNSSFPYNAAGLLDDAIRKNKTDDFILIVPTGRLSRNLKYDTINKYFERNNKPCGNINIMNLESFASSCFDGIMSGSGYRKISDSYRLALTEEALQAAETEFYINNDKPANYYVLERLSNIIYGLREDGIAYQKMLEEIKIANSEQLTIKDKKKYSDIAKIMEEYEKLLGKKYLDPPALIQKLVNIANEHFLKDNKGSFPDDFLADKLKIKQILIYGFSEFKLPEVAFLSKFSMSSIPLAIHLDFSEINGPLFGNLSDMKALLLEAGFEFFYTEDENISIENLPEYDLSKDPKYFLRRWLFNVERDIIYKGLNKSLNIIEFETPEEEVKQISKLIKHLILDKGYKASDIAVVSRDTGMYSPLLRSYFSLENIPADFSDRYALAESQLVISIISIIETVINGFRRNDIFKTLESRFVEIINSEGKPVNPSNLLKVATELKFSQSNFSTKREFWIKRIQSMIDYLENLNREYDEITGNELDKFNIEEQLKSYKTALEDFIAFSDFLPASKKYYSPEEFRKLIIEDIIKKFDFHGNIKKMYDKIADNNDKNSYKYDLEIEKIERFSRALRELIRLTEEMTFVLSDKANKKYPATELVNKLKIAVSAGKYQTRERLNYGVTVTSVEQIRYIPFKVTILCGLNDGIFPMPYRPESFLGKELQNSEQTHLHSEQIHFYQFLINGSEYFSTGEKQIYLTYTVKNGRNEITRSTFIDSLIKVTGLQKGENIFYVSGAKSQNINKLPWLNAISNRTEIAHLIGSDKKFHRNNFETIFLGKRNETIDYVSKYFDNTYNRYDDNLQHGNFRTLDDKSLSFLKKVPQNVYSVTDFDTYAACNLQYFIKKMLKIKAKPDTESAFTALEFGNIFHSILQKFYLQLQSSSEEEWLRPEPDSSFDLPILKPVNILKIQERDEMELLLKLLKVIEEEFQDIRLDHPIVKSVMREIIGTGNHYGWAEMFIKSDLKRAEWFDSYPVLFELEFGALFGGNQIPAVDIGGINLKGKIDRIELTGQSGFDPKYSNYLFTVVDYKSSESSATSNGKIISGKKFQMPLYSLAIEKILTDYYGIDTAFKGGAYYIIKSKDTELEATKIVLMPAEFLPEAFLKSKAKKISIEEQKEYLENSLSYAKDIIKNISVVNFSDKPNDKSACTFCTYQPVCRINERAVIQNDEDAPES